MRKFYRPWGLFPVAYPQFPECSIGCGAWNTRLRYSSPNAACWLQAQQHNAHTCFYTQQGFTEGNWSWHVRLLVRWLCVITKGALQWDGLIWALTIELGSAVQPFSLNFSTDKAAVNWCHRFTLAAEPGRYMGQHKTLILNCNSGQEIMEYLNNNEEGDDDNTWRATTPNGNCGW